MSLVVGTREIEFNVPSGKVAQDETISCASSIFFNCKKTDVLSFSIDCASSLPRFATRNSHYPSILGTGIWKLRTVSARIGSLFSRLFGDSAPQSSGNFVFLFFGEIFPPNFSSFGHVFSSLLSVDSSLVGKANSCFSFRRMLSSLAAFGKFNSLLFRQNKSFNSLSSVCTVGEIGITGNATEVSNPLYFGCLPLGDRTNFKNLHERLDSKVEHIFYPICTMMALGKLTGSKVPRVSPLRIFRLSDVANEPAPWVYKTVDVSGIIGKRTSRLFVQVAHGLASIVRGLSAHFYYTSLGVA